MPEPFDVRYLTPLGIFATAISFLFGVYVYRRKTNTEVFLEYTRRYDEVMRTFPAEARHPRLNSRTELPIETEELSTAILRYINLCSEEFYLWKRGYLSSDIWGIWEGELRRTLATPLYRRAWNRLRAEFVSFPEFVEYVDQTQRRDGLRDR